jgi:hypothetical protein
VDAGAGSETRLITGIVIILALVAFTMIAVVVLGAADE